jgi:hypothetical protein
MHIRRSCDDRLEVTAIGSLQVSGLTGKGSASADQENVDQEEQFTGALPGTDLSAVPEGLWPAVRQYLSRMRELDPGGERFDGRAAGRGCGGASGHGCAGRCFACGVLGDGGCRAAGAGRAVGAR